MRTQYRILCLAASVIVLAGCGAAPAALPPAPLAVAAAGTAEATAAVTPGVADRDSYGNDSYCPGDGDKGAGCHSSYGAGSNGNSYGNQHTADSYSHGDKCAADRYSDGHSSPADGDS